MKRLLQTVCFAFCCTALAAIFAAAPAHAAINKQISFQGKLTNPDGTNVTDGTFSIRFRIYTDPTADAANTCAANTCKWEETQGSVAVSGGLFQVNLGSVTTLPASVDFNTSALYLGVKVGSDAEMTPRIQLTAAPYAFNSDLLDGLDSTGFVQLSPGSQQTGNINVSGTITSGAVNGVSIGSTIQPSSAGALTIQSNGASALNLDTGASAAINIGGTNATSIVFGNGTSNPNISFAGSGTFGTTTGAVSLNGNVTVASGKTFTITSGSFTQTYSASTASTAHAISVTNSNTSAGVTINGVNVTPTNTATATSGTNVLNGVNFAAGGALGGTDQTNGINFASATGYTNFINSPSFVLSSGGAISGVTTIATSSTINSNTFSSSTLTFGAASMATVQSAGSQALTITGNAASTWSTTAGNLTLQAGSGTVSLGSSTVLSATGALSLNSGSAATLTIDSGTTGALNIGTSANAKTITIGNTTGATVIANTVGTSTTAFKVQGPSSAVYLNIDSSNNRLYVGNPTADSTAFLLILDYKNSTGDPTAVNGAEYYNSANNKFRCAQNSIWMDCTNGFNTSTLSADQAATQSSTTMQSVTALGFTANANTTYVFDAWIPINDSNTTADSKYTFTTPTSSTLNILTDYYSSATANVICNIVTSATACANTTVNLANHFIEVRGQVIVAGTAGTVQFQFAQNTSTAVSFPVIKKGATITWHQSN
ncbi:MAG TPA: hypothetical protein VF466_00585 [Candidatus Saccharimonadales bacterium]